MKRRLFLGWLAGIPLGFGFFKTKKAEAKPKPFIPIERPMIDCMAHDWEREPFRQDLRNYIRVMLGHPVLDIELGVDQLDFAIDQALRDLYYGMSKKERDKHFLYYVRGIEPGETFEDAAQKVTSLSDLLLIQSLYDTNGKLVACYLTKENINKTRYLLYAGAWAYATIMLGRIRMRFKGDDQVMRMNERNIASAQERREEFKHGIALAFGENHA